MPRSPVREQVEVTCVCGKPFMVHPYRAKEAKYCSMDCQRQYRSYARRGKIEAICEMCGTNFVTWECKQKRGNGKFCSKDCFDKSQMSSRPFDFTVDENNCFIVTSHIPYSRGYAVVSHNGKRKPLHRLVYEECFGDIPEGLVVRHKCDVRNCINPEHLEIGTQYDNVMDTVKRNRTLRGIKHPQCKISEETARKIKLLLAQGERTCDLVRKFGINKSTICNIKQGKTWKHIVVR